MLRSIIPSIALVAIATGVRPETDIGLREENDLHTNEGNACLPHNYYKDVSWDLPTLRAKIKSATRKLRYKQCYIEIATLDQDPNNHSNVNLLYCKHSMSKEARGNDGWNREHLWPKSFGASCKKANRKYDKRNGAFTDLHHLFATDTTVNADRSSEYFNMCTGDECVYPANEEDGYTADEKVTGDSKSHDFWMPPPKSRGIIARALFFMALRYDGAEKNTFDLTLSECPRYCKFALGKLSILLQWHSDYKPTAAEVDRTTQICRLQGNRNPFIDHPELVERFFARDDPDPHLVSTNCTACNSTSPRATDCTATSDEEIDEDDAYEKDEQDTYGRGQKSQDITPSAGSCHTYGCGSIAEGQTCQCDDSCTENGNCCTDYENVCLASCERFGCSNEYKPGNGCQCNSACAEHENCCDDYNARCLEGESAHVVPSCELFGCDDEYKRGNACQCNSACVHHNNCCSDYHDLCLASCEEFGCDDEYKPGNSCQCNSACDEHKNCCDDYQAVCRASCHHIGCDTKYNKANKCQCNSKCQRHKNCCNDYQTICLAASSCQSIGCSRRYNPENVCQCNSKCKKHKNCCGDYDSQCD